MDKSKLIEELKASGNRSTLGLIKQLIQAQMEDTRILNDDARGDQDLINKGKIENCKYLLAVLNFD